MRDKEKPDLREPSFPLRLPQDLDAKVRRRAIEEDRTITSVIVRALRESFDREDRRSMQHSS